MEEPLDARLVATNFDVEFISRLTKNAIFSQYRFFTFQEVALVQELVDKCEIFLANIEYPLTEEVLGHFTSLKYLISPATGTTHIDLEHLSRKNVDLISISSRREITDKISSSSEFAWGLFIALHRGIVLAERKGHRYPEHRNIYWSSQITSLKIGIIGFGRIGRQILNYAKVFGAQVMVFDQFLKVEDDAVEEVSLEILLRESDAVFITASVGKNVRESMILDANRIKLLGSSSIVVNVSRGCLVDEVSLLDALRRGNLRGYATDVLSSCDLEASKSTSMTELQIEKAMSEGLNLVVTPHIAGASEDALEMILFQLFLELERLLLNSRSKLHAGE